MVVNGYDHWIIAFSGGKDSSLVTVLVIELLRRQAIKNIEVDVVFSDTMMELPPFGENAIALIKYILEIGARNSLPLRTHIAAAPAEHRFWFLVLGKGYPPPHNHLRWCAERLKIWPSSQIMKKFITKSSVVLTGVRWGESDSRTGRLKTAMCTNDSSECGQGAWLYSNSAMGLPNLAPIVHWRTCKV